MKLFGRDGRHLNRAHTHQMVVSVTIKQLYYQANLFTKRGNHLRDVLSISKSSKYGPNPASFVYFRPFSQYIDVHNTKFDGKSVDGVLGI